MNCRLFRRPNLFSTSRVRPRGYAQSTQEGDANRTSRSILKSSRPSLQSALPQGLKPPQVGGDLSRRNSKTRRDLSDAELCRLRQTRGRSNSHFRRALLQSRLTLDDELFGTMSCNELNTFLKATVPSRTSFSTNFRRWKSIIDSK